MIPHSLRDIMSIVVVCGQCTILFRARISCIQEAVPSDLFFVILRFTDFCTRISTAASCMGAVDTVTGQIHEYVITWKHFPRYWPFVRGIHRDRTLTGEFPAQGPVTQSFDVLFDKHPNNRLSKQSQGWWFETPSRSLWRPCNVGS